MLLLLPPLSSAGFQPLLLLLLLLPLLLLPLPLLLLLYSSWWWLRDGQALLDPESRTDLYLASPTKGKMELVTGATWYFVELDLPKFEWIPDMSAITSDLET